MRLENYNPATRSHVAGIIDIWAALKRASDPCFVDARELTERKASFDHPTWQRFIVFSDRDEPLGFIWLWKRAIEDHPTRTAMGIMPAVTESVRADVEDLLFAAAAAWCRANGWDRFTGACKATGTVVEARTKNHFDAAAADNARGEREIVLRVEDIDRKVAERVRTRRPRI